MLAVSCTGSNEGGKFFFFKVACRCGPCNCWAIKCRKTQIWRIALNHWGFISKEQTWHILFLPDYQPFSLLVHYCGLPPSLMTIFYLIWQSLMTKWSKCPKAELLRNDASEKCDLSGFYWSGVLYWSSLYGNEKAIGSVFGQPCCLTGVWRGWSESDVNSLIWANVHCMTWFL